MFDDTSPMAHRILDHAQLLVQTVGYNGFSYAEIAEELGIRKATIHYYFRTKTELCVTLLRRYRTRFRSKVSEATEPLASARERLSLYISFYQEASAEGRLCPCGVLTGELDTLDPDIRGEIRGFFEEQIAWIEAQFAEARRSKELRCNQPARELAVALIGVIEGGMLVARSMGDTKVFADAISGTMSVMFL